MPPCPIAGTVALATTSLEGRSWWGCACGAWHPIEQAACPAAVAAAIASQR